jgi:hypothetical protein
MIWPRGPTDRQGGAAMIVSGWVIFALLLVACGPPLMFVGMFMLLIFFIFRN